MIAQFKKRRGYDPLSWIPILTGQVVESAEASDQFLWDFRKTIADLIADEHHGQVEASLHERGMGRYGESHEGGRAFVGDGREVKKFNEVPMSAMWTQVPGVNKEQYGYNADDRESASVAHIYGQNLAAAESMTAAAAPWAWSPATLKLTADQEFLNGINRFVIHESAHQPLVGKALGFRTSTTPSRRAIRAFSSCIASLRRAICTSWITATTKYTFADVKPYKANSPLLPSGLLGPVHLYSIAMQ
jgi:hypothetical protein